VRLQLAAACALLSGSPAGAEPDGDRATVVVRTAGYVDDDHTAISTSLVSVRARPVGDVFVSARYVADAVSSASVDVVTAATGRWTELRSEVSTGVAYADGTTSLSADYVFSHENDWDSHTVSAGGSRDLFGHNLTLGAGASFVDNRVGRADDANFHERMRVLGGALRAVWVAGKRDIFQGAYDLSRASGYQASPYRYAFVDDPAGVPIASPRSRRSSARGTRSRCAGTATCSATPRCAATPAATPMIGAQRRSRRAPNSSSASRRSSWARTCGSTRSATRRSTRTSTTGRAAT